MSPEKKEKRTLSRCDFPNPNKTGIKRLSKNSTPIPIGPNHNKNQNGLRTNPIRFSLLDSIVNYIIFICISQTLIEKSRGSAATGSSDIQKNDFENGLPMKTLSMKKT
jgi:hypothetical protein